MGASAHGPDPPRRTTVGRRPRAVFRHDDEILARFPTLRAAVLEVDGVHDGPSPPGLLEAFAAEQAAVNAELAGRSSAELPSIAAWRTVFSSFGVSPTRYRNSAEALLRRVQKKGGVPSVGLLVDLGNLVSIRHRLPLAIIDADRVSGAVTVRVADGSERFDDLGGTDAERPAPGEVVMVDDAGEVVTRRWCWRQSTRSGVSPATTRLVIAVEGHHEGAADDVADAATSFEELFRRFLPDAVCRVGPPGSRDR
jgi:DNA/RNA-binding domain of Phe-tRNA-synthetase-like protein